MREKAPQAIHVEFADFTDHKFFNIFVQHVVQKANSLGMNEQELLMLLEYWDGKRDFLFQAKESMPTVDTIID